VAADQGQKAATGREMIMMGASILRGHSRMEGSEKSRGPVGPAGGGSHAARVQAAGMPERKLLAWWFHPHCPCVLPSESYIREDPEDLYLRCSPSTASKRVSWLASGHKKAPKGRGVGFRGSISSDRNQHQVQPFGRHFLSHRPRHGNVGS